MVVVKRLMPALAFLAVFGVSAAGAQELCVDTSINADQFVIKITGVDDNSLDLVLNRINISNPYVAYGAMTILPNLVNPTRVLMSWEYQTQNGPIGFYCDISFIFPTSNASRTTMFGGFTPSTQHGTCRLFSCNPSAAEEAAEQE
ncbi:MAG: hypothetical protein ACRD21_11805 [Vicinamibacteria bacterium]